MKQYEKWAEEWVEKNIDLFVEHTEWDFELAWRAGFHKAIEEISYKDQEWFTFVLSVGLEDTEVEAMNQEPQ